jgi:hypothetical protein
MVDALMVDACDAGMVGHRQKPASFKKAEGLEAAGGG